MVICKVKQILMFFLLDEKANKLKKFRSRIYNAQFILLNSSINEYIFDSFVFYFSLARSESKEMEVLK